MHISAKLEACEKAGKPSFSFEYFPPKTAQGVQNLYDRMEQMGQLGPQFIDITWNAGGRMSDLTTDMVNVSQTMYGLETCMHLTCTGMEKSKVDAALKNAYNGGCTNILALRGDPPRDNEKWSAVPGGFRYAKDLVKHIKEGYGNYFDIGVAGYPEGCEEDTPPELLLDHLKEKIDAGGTFIITQMFYDVDIFLDWVAKVRAKGITVPIIPGIMPIHTYAAFIRRATWTKCHVPKRWLELLDPVKNDDIAVREIGRDLVVEMCRKILDSGINQLHFYTMNLATATRMVLEGLDLLPSLETPEPKPLPFKMSLGLNRREETVRPIFWKNRHKSYIARTREWDEFPNGRWGDARSPAFAGVDGYGAGLKGTNEQNIKLWGEPKTIRDIAKIFVRYIQGDLESIPWSESAVDAAADPIRQQLVKLNERGFLTTNSQCALNGVKSSDPIHGWGPKNGYVYQKMYLELLVSPDNLSELITRIERSSDLTYYAVNKAGVLKHNAPAGGGPNAVTWGVFPGKEIVQPTIVELISFLAWKDELYRLGEDWAACHAHKSASRHIISDVMENWYLVNIVNNNFLDNQTVFDLFDDLKVPNIDQEIEIDKHLEELKITNGASTEQPEAPAAVANGVSA